MLNLLLVAFSVVVYQVSCACDFPNGTATTLHWWQCGGDPYVHFNDAVATDTSGKQEYPIRLTEPLIVKSNIVNNLGVFSDPNLVEGVTIWQYAKSWSGSSCSWEEVPTFGLFDNVNACELGGVQCPVNTGNQLVTIKLDFTAFQSIINGLPNDVPYQMKITLTDNKTGKGACVMAQARAYTKK